MKNQAANPLPGLSPAPIWLVGAMLRASGEPMHCAVVVRYDQGMDLLLLATSAGEIEVHDPDEVGVIFEYCGLDPSVLQYGSSDFVADMASGRFDDALALAAKGPAAP